VTVRDYSKRRSPLDATTDFWTKKGIDGPNGWAFYWNTRHEPHRDVLVQTLQQLPPFTSLFEVGCGPGMNLWRIQEAFPDAILTGLDVSQAAVDYGAERFAEADRQGLLAGTGRVTLCAGTVPDALEAFDPADVVLSCYALTYVPPTLIEPTLTRLVELARQAIVLAEPMVVPGLPGGIVHALGESRYDYLRWFQARSDWQVTTMKPIIVNRMNRLLVAQRNDRA
jgi:SAM-dependent methyltransferase